MRASPSNHLHWSAPDRIFCPLSIGLLFVLCTCASRQALFCPDTGFDLGDQGQGTYLDLLTCGPASGYNFCRPVCRSLEGVAVSVSCCSWVWATWCQIMSWYYMLLFAATGTCLYNGLYHRWLTSLGLMVGAIVFYGTYVLLGLTLNLHSLLV